MHDSYIGCVSKAPTAEENPAAYVSITRSLPLCCMKNRLWATHSMPPTQSICWGFWYSAGGKQGGGGSKPRWPGTQETQGFRTSSNCGSSFWREFWPSLIYLHTYNSISTDVAGQVLCEKSFDPASRYFLDEKKKKSSFNKMTHTQAVRHAHWPAMVYSHTQWGATACHFAATCWIGKEIQQAWDKQEYKTRTTASQNSKGWDTSAAHDADSMWFGRAPHKNSIRVCSPLSDCAPRLCCQEAIFCTGREIVKIVRV